ncbi:MAG: hypothetical protein F2536_01840 [Actinobacteria bacterium]|uniref:Unannotated protein n=1 Tax=freshwater metagenome TaxID=449393 RepID=A0A6J6BV75_9ZZZZ|nr:hypothetical protein [Actinomycetota bacterium]
MKFSLGNALKASVATASLVAIMLVPAPASAALKLPSGSWPVCNESRITYCVESVSIEALGSAGPEELQWFPSGTVSEAAAPAGPVEPAPSIPLDPTMQADPNAPVEQPLVVETAAGPATFGRWTSPNWSANGLGNLGYQGLNISIATANAFTNHLFFTVQPVKVDGSGVSTQARQLNNTGFLANLDPDVEISFKVRTGEAITGVIVGFGINITNSNRSGSFTFSGYPVVTPKVNDARKCTGEDGAADALVVGLQGFVVVENDDMGFGVEGLSGNMVVYTNGQCQTSTPSWDERTETMNWTVGAPHFAPDGVTVNKGVYRAIIPANDALLLWGLTDIRRAVSALTIQVIEEEGGPSVAARKVAVRNGNIIIDVTGFSYSKQKIVIKKNNKASKRFFANKRTVRCFDAATKKTTTYRNVYGCPAGTKRR